MDINFENSKKLEVIHEYFIIWQKQAKTAKKPLNNVYEVHIKERNKSLMAKSNSS